jgi:hypothetical protein
MSSLHGAEMKRKHIRKVGPSVPFFYLRNHLTDFFLNLVPENCTYCCRGHYSFYFNTKSLTSQRGTELHAMKTFCEVSFLSSAQDGGLR